MSNFDDRMGAKVKIAADLERDYEQATSAGRNDKVTRMMFINLIEEAYAEIERFEAFRKLYDTM